MRNEILVVILAMAAVTFATRFGCIVPALFLPKGQLDITLHNHYLLAGILAAVVAYKSRNIVYTIVLGMGTMIVLRLLDQ